MSTLINPNMVSGRVRGWRIDEGSTRREPLSGWRDNQTMYDWGTVVGKLLQGLSGYHVNGMYVEFENTAGSVSIPSFDRSGGVSYYQGLSGSGVRDFLRVPMTAATLSSTDETLFPGGNRVTFFAQTQGSVGQHGLTFSAGANSKVFGAALVAMPEQADYTQDLVFSRFYFDTAAQIAKVASAQVGVEWAVELQ